MLRRESTSCAGLAFYSSVCLGLDVCKQLVIYSLKYYNHNDYPLPQTQLVAINETLKFAVFFCLVLMNSKLWSMHWSVWYTVPSVIYAVNNNIFYFALHFVTPPVWNILIQLRILFTALSYKCFFRKHVSRVQWAGLLLLVVAIVMTQFTQESEVSGGLSSLSVACALAVVASAFSVLGTITMEYLFKLDAGSFSEKQLQLYLFSCLTAWLLYVPDLVFTEPKINPRHPVIIPDEDEPESLWLLVLLSFILTCTSGVAVAIVVKKLDNIVKLYTQALANVVMSFACAYLFPDYFEVTWVFFISLLIMCVGIFLYENKGVIRRTHDPYLPLRSKTGNY